MVIMTKQVKTQRAVNKMESNTTSLKILEPSKLALEDDARCLVIENYDREFESNGLDFLEEMKDFALENGQKTCAFWKEMDHIGEENPVIVDKFMIAITPREEGQCLLDKAAEKFGDKATVMEARFDYLLLPEEEDMSNDCAPG